MGGRFLGISKLIFSIIFSILSLGLPLSFFDLFLGLVCVAVCFECLGLFGVGL